MYYTNLTLLTDLYQLTMMQGYYFSGKTDKTVVFDMYYRDNPCGNGFAICCGLEQVIEYVSTLRFSNNDLNYLRSTGVFKEEFLDYLKDFKFTGDIYAIEEGTVVFPNEPLIRVTSSIMEAQLLETTLLNIVNHQSLIATKAARVCWAAKNDIVLEFGLRRAQGPDAGIYGARAAVIGGCHATSNVLAGQMFDIPIKGTHAHSWVMSFDDELTAFRTYAEIYPENIILLVDTYDTLRMGVPNAIKVFKELKAENKLPKSYGIRLDSGDMAYLSKAARKMLDDEGFENAVISASSDLDEYLIEELKVQHAAITLWGIGTKLITSNDCPAFGGVYKLCAEGNSEGELIPKIKLSENPDKITTPGVKKLYRIYDAKTNKMKADLLCLEGETLNIDEQLILFDPNATWKRMVLKSGDYYIKELLTPVFVNGECVYTSPDAMSIREHCKREVNSLWDEFRRLLNPHVYPVDLSDKLYRLKQQMINEIRNELLEDE